jgi:hypothetical protein
LILIGAYGSGKTECAMALACGYVADGPVTLVDLDVITPYFRSLDHRGALEAAGVTVLCPDARAVQLDTPALTPMLRDALMHPQGKTVVDVGGDPAGATVLGQYASALPAYDLWGVVNFARPTTATPESAAAYLHAIVAASRLRLTGLLSNTHLLAQTTAADVLDGLAQLQELAVLLAVPVVAVCAPALLPLPPLPFPLLPITPKLKRPWEG